MGLCVKITANKPRDPIAWTKRYITELSPLNKLALKYKIGKIITKLNSVANNNTNQLFLNAPAHSEKDVPKYKAGNQKPISKEIKSIVGVWARKLN